MVRIGFSIWIVAAAWAVFPACKQATPVNGNNAATPDVISHNFLVNDTLSLKWQQHLLSQAESGKIDFETRKRYLVERSRPDSVEVLTTYLWQGSYLNVYQKREQKRLGGCVVRNEGIYLQPGLEVGCTKAQLQEVIGAMIGNEVINIGDHQRNHYFTLVFHSDTLDTFFFKGEP